MLVKYPSEFFQSKNILWKKKYTKKWLQYFMIV